MWLLHLLPDWLLMFVVYAALGIGAALTIAGWVTKNIIAQIGGVVLLVAGVYWYGGYTTEMIWREEVAKLEEQVKAAEEKSARVNTVIKKVYVDRVKRVTEEKVVIQDRIIKEKELIDKDCRVPAEAINILNSAARAPKATVEVGPLQKDEK
jgi:hypothetical protein